MRFTHPELYETRYWFPREQALGEMQRTGLLQRGMTHHAVHRLLGYPDIIEEYDGSSVIVRRGVGLGGDIMSTTESGIAPKEIWIYEGLKRSLLKVHFAHPSLRVTRFEWLFEPAEGRVVVEDRIW